MDPFTVEHASPLTAWGQVQRDLRQRIDAGEFEPDSRIPSESELVRRYGVSRVTIRRAIEALVVDGYLRSRRGSGTFVAERKDMLRVDIDLVRPWREQLLTTGHAASSRLIEVDTEAVAPSDILRFVEYDAPEMLRFARHVQEVDGVPVAVTESWTPRRLPEASVEVDETAVVAASSGLQIAFANAAQAHLLHAYLDVPLLVMTTCSRLRQGGALVEVARTAWLGNRVRFTYERHLRVAHIDMTHLLPATTQR